VPVARLGSDREEDPAVLRGQDAKELLAGKERPKQLLQGCEHIVALRCEAGIQSGLARKKLTNEGRRHLALEILVLVAGVLEGALALLLLGCLYVEIDAAELLSRVRAMGAVVIDNA
jgi:hypothetical protein